MDRDHRWERTKRAYDVITGVLGAPLAPSLREAIESSYSAGITDEFIDPVRIAPLEGHANGSSNYPPVQEGDGFVFWNFREDRARQIVECLTATNFSGFSRTNDGTTLLSAPFASGRTLCLTEYDSEFLLPVLFPPQHVTHHLGAVVSEAGLTQLRAAETEKYPHVTYFLNGGEESPLPGEERVLVPSPRDVATYDLKPEMSAHAVTDAVVNAINGRQFDLIVVNLANCDMVGHTGVLEAAVRAVEVVDSCLGRILAALTANGGAGVILADHGNAEQMINYATGEPHTAHTTYPVPFIVVEAPVNGLAPTHLGPNGALCDVAPTLLKLMGIRQPPEMSGKALF
jgi:2,3-bisphosphoglycerate-independent phosphoglycerate mutase